MFFKLSAPHVSFREYMYEGNLITMPLVLMIAVIVKLFRIPIPGSTDIPPVASLRGFRVPEQKIDAEILASLTDLDQQLHELGFTRIDWIGIKDLQHTTRYGGAAYRSAEGDTVAWIRYRLWPNLERRNKFARLALYSLSPQGEIIMTTAATRDLLDPPDWQVEYHPKVTATKLRDLHQEHVRRVLGSVRPMMANDLESAFDLLEHTHEEFVEFQADRGVFVRQSPLPQPSAVTALPQNTDVESVPETIPPEAVLSDNAAGLIDRPSAGHEHFGEDVPDHEVQVVSVEDFSDEAIATEHQSRTAEIDETLPIVEAVRKQETKQSGWLSKLMILGVSIALFVLLGAWQWELELVLVLVPILFVHELGHYVAMKAFGYKNIHMFFIPLLGAAVSGRNYRVSGWKKTLVSLAGPLPSIGLGLALGGIGFWLDNEWCIKGSLITLILNVLNLAPFLPLDGGQVAHVTLFSRSNIIDLLFRIGTIGVLMVVAWLLQAKFLFGLGIAMIIGIPTVWRTMKATEAVRRLNLPEPTNDQMPVEAIRAVVDEIQRAKLPTQGTATLAKLTLSVYENVIMRPPSWPATLGIWALYFGGLFSGVIGMGVIAWASTRNGLLDFIPEVESKYERVEIDEGDFRLGKLDPDSEDVKTDLLVWRFADSESATIAFENLTEATQDSVSRLGNVVFTSQTFAPDDQIELFNELDDLNELDDFGALDESFEARMAAAERRANNDPRLDHVDGAQWRRAFGQSHPQLMIVVPREQAVSIVDATESLTYDIGNYSPIAPWTPRVRLTKQQEALQEKLRVLQGLTEDTPWETVQPPQDDDAELSGDDFRASMLATAERMKQTQANRTQWIVEQVEQNEGDAQQLYRAYADFEAASKAWREDKRDFNDKGEPPQLIDVMKPLLPALGYFHDDHPLLATSATVDAYEIDPDDESEFFHESFPLDYEGRSIVYLNIYAARDTAAAYACVLAWLKKQDVNSVVMTYSTPKDAE